MSTRYGPILMTVSLVVVYRIRKLLRDEQRNETTSYTKEPISRHRPLAV